MLTGTPFQVTTNMLAVLWLRCMCCRITQESFVLHDQCNVVYSCARRLRAWGSLMGCSIRQPAANTTGAHGSRKQVEAEASQGLRFMHAYSLLDLKEISIGTSDEHVPGAVNGRVRLVRCRNPWGYGEVMVFVSAALVSCRVCSNDSLC